MAANTPSVLQPTAAARKLFHSKQAHPDGHLNSTGGPPSSASNDSRFQASRFLYF